MRRKVDVNKNYSITYKIENIFGLHTSTLSCLLSRISVAKSFSNLYKRKTQNRERTFIIGFKDEADWDFEPNKKTSSSIFNSHLPLVKSKAKKKCLFLHRFLI